MRFLRGCLAKLLLVTVCSMAAIYTVAALTNPWAFHIGGRWTLLLFWHGYGKLDTKGGAEYPLYIRFFPSYDTGVSTLHREDLRPTGALRGSAALCTAPGVIQPLEIRGTVYSAWRTTEGSLMDFSARREVLRRCASEGRIGPGGQVAWAGTGGRGSQRRGSRAGDWPAHCRRDGNAQLGKLFGV